MKKMTKGNDNTAARPGTVSDVVNCERHHPYDFLPRTVLWYPISEVQPNLLVLPLGSILREVTSVDNQIRIYVEQFDLRGVDVVERARWAAKPENYYELLDFRCVRAGMPIPKNFKYVGYATCRDGRCRNHVYYTGRPIDA